MKVPHLPGEYVEVKRYTDSQVVLCPDGSWGWPDHHHAGDRYFRKASGTKARTEGT